MVNIKGACFTNKKNDWSTPQDFFDKLNEQYHFTLDPCASKDNTKCKKFYTEEDDGLSKSWAGETVFMNPPYNDCYHWIEKAYNEAKDNNAIVVALVPARTDVRWFHSFCLPFSNILSNTNIDYAWAAGLIDGEGCIFIRKSKPTLKSKNRTDQYDLGMHVTMTSQRTIQKLYSLFNVGSLAKTTRSEDSTWKDVYRWTVRSRDAEDVILKILPYMVTKKEQAFFGLEFNDVKGNGIKGKRLSSELLKKREFFFNRMKELKKKEPEKFNKVTTHITFIKGRLKFGNSSTPAPFPSMVVVFGEKR